MTIFDKTAFRRIIFVLCTVSAACLISACGYHMGSMMHPQIKTIAIADIQNNTKEPLLTEIMRKNLAEQFMTDGSLKITDKETADCILYCQINQVNNQVVRESSSDGQQTYRPKELRLSVTGDFTVIVPGKSEPLIPRRQISGYALYQYEGDVQITKFSGLQLACLRFAQMAVQYTTEAW